MLIPVSSPEMLFSRFVICLVVLFSCASESLKAQTYGLVQLADGFDFPVGKPDADGYYVYRGFTRNGHLGEDWNGNGMGNTDLGDPIYSIANGLVIFSEDYEHGWGNVIIVRHAYRGKDGQISYIDSLYGHFQKRFKSVGDHVKRGDQLGTMGRGPRNMYTAHLHFEIRKDLRVGMARSKYPRDYSVYYSPRHFIRDHRKLRFEPRKVKVPLNTFLKSNPNLMTVKEMEVPSLALRARTGPEAPPVVEKVVEEQTHPENADPVTTQSMWDKIIGMFVGNGETVEPPITVNNPPAAAKADGTSQE